MQRYFIFDDQSITSDHFRLEDNDGHHIVNVMRMQTGEKIICNLPNGEAYICTITEVDGISVTVKKVTKIDEDKELPVHVTIAQGLPKGSKLELIVQKGTELGASAFILMQADRSVAKWDEKTTNKKLPRFEKIIKEASEQCHRTIIPEVTGTFTLEHILQSYNHFDHVLFAYEEEAKTNMFSSFHQTIEKMKLADKVLLFIGPEGGFSKSEVQILQEYGAKSVRLGKRILRTETAPLYALSSISYYFEEYHNE